MRPPLQLALSTLLAMTLLLASCSQAPSAAVPSLDPAQTQQALDSVSDDASTVTSAINLSDPVEALTLLAGRTATFTDVGSATLPRGDYVWTEGASDWTWLGASDDLGLDWDFGSPNRHTASLDVNWDASAPTTTVLVAGRPDQEVPQGALATLSVDAVEVGRLEAQVAWQDTTCGTILEPANAVFRGYLGQGKDRVAWDPIELRIFEGDGATTIATRGAVTATSGAHGDTSATGLRVDWDVAVRGPSERDASDCTLSDFTPQDGHVGFGVAGSQRSLGFYTRFSDVNLASFAPSVGLSGGRLSIDGVVAVTFEGTLDNPDGDDFPGENLILTFKGGVQMSLEAFLRKHTMPVNQLSGLLRYVLR